MAEESGGINPIDFIRENSDVIAQQVSEYGYIVMDSLYFIVLGMAAVFILHKLASRFLYPYLPNARLARVVFGTLYVLVLVVTVLIALRRSGFDLGGVGQILILLVLVGAVIIYFLIPFLPKLPFMPGHMIETGGVMGIVDSISSFHTTLRKFDGTIVFLPNALVMASRIQNFSYTPTRRIEIKLVIARNCDTEAVRASVLELVAAEPRVQAEPAPAMFAVHGDASGVAMTLYCWVENANFLPVQSDLWLGLMKLADAGAGITLATPRQEVELCDSRQHPVGLGT
jgi:small conductance mechanosensitive channel